MNKIYVSLLLLLLLIPGHVFAACVNSININDSESDVWEASCESENSAGSYAKYYTFSLASSQEIIIDLTSTRDTLLFLLSGTGTGGTVIEEDDDGGSGRNSKITRTLPAGSYTVEATTYQPNETGSFTVTVTSTTPPSDDCDNPLETNTDVSSSWNSDCTSTHRAGSYAKYFTFVLPVSQEVAIDLTSSTNTYMFLLQGSGRNGTVLEEDDEGGTGTNSRITRYLTAGSYTIEATTKTAATTGNFSVSVTAEVIPPPSSCENLINPNDNKDGAWGPDCTSENREGRYARYYTFVLLDTQEVEINLESTRDSYMYLLAGAGQNGNVLAENDDGGTGDNSRIFLTLNKGTYTIEATTYAAATTGSFTVTVSSAPPGCDDCPFQINAGLNDAWFNSVTSGQGFNITVYPKIKQVFVTWFTFDTERPPEDVTAILGGPGQRWLTAQGPYDDDTAMLTIYVTEGGVFDSAMPAATTDQDGDGTMKIEFSDCNEGLVTYEITSLDISGEIPIERIVLDNVELCEMLSEP